MPHSSTGRAVESGARTPRRMHGGGIQSLLVLRRDAEVKYSLDIKKNTPFVRVLTPARIRARCRSARVGRDLNQRRRSTAVKTSLKK